VDEADAFLRQRSGSDQSSSSSLGMGEDMRNALNAFLYQTGTQVEETINKIY